MLPPQPARGLAYFFVLICIGTLGRTTAQVPGYPPEVREAQYRSDGDGTQQPTLIWYPKSDEAVPLLVALHTWSSDYRQAGGEAQYARWCQQAGWAFVHPNFRGINKTPAALGSDLVVADVRSVVAFAKSQTRIDPNRIYCIGVSGGGHASLLMAARAPEIWAGVSAWCGISDITRWHNECKGSPFERYAKMIEAALEGSPTASELCRKDAWHRSPLNWLESADNLPPLDINHGIDDGRAGSVPFSHSLRAWNVAVDLSDRMPNESIERFYATRQVPDSLKDSNEAAPDELYGKHTVLFRRTSPRVRLTVFDGGHEIVHDAALNWLSAQVKGKPAVWQAARRLRLDSKPAEQQSGK